MMGCTGSTPVPSTLNGERALADFEQQVDVAREQKALDVRALVLLMWRAREENQLTNAITELLTLFSSDVSSFNGIEFYLPQIVHLIVHLEVGWPTSVLEQFLLAIAQQSIHLALQVEWILQAHLEDYQAEDSEGKANPHANIILYNTCARLRHELELAVVFGCPISSVAEADFKAGKITLDEFLEVKRADQKLQAFRITDAVEGSSGFDFDGLLDYKHRKKRDRFHMNRWIERRFVIQHRVLYCLRVSDNVVKRAIPLHDFVIGDKPSPDASKPFYFELNQTGTDRQFLLSAKTQYEKDACIAAIRSAILAPPDKFVSGSMSLEEAKQRNAGRKLDVSSLSQAEVARYGFFRSELDFVKTLTDISEELRFVDNSSRKTSLREKLAKYEIPGCVYIPLCGSTDPFERVESCIVEESSAFSTKERCPCKMVFKVVRDDLSEGADTATYLQQMLGLQTDSSLHGTDENSSVGTSENESLIPVDDDSLAKDKEAGSSAEDVNLDALPKTNMKKSEKTEHEVQGWSSRSSERQLLKMRELTSKAHSLVKSTSDNQDNPAGAAAPIANQEQDKGQDKAAESGPAAGTERIYLPALGKFAESPSPNAESADREDGKDRVGRLMAKSNDDLRQEVFIMQLIRYLHDIWLDAGLKLFLRPYRILSTSQTCGMLEFLHGSTSFDALKKDNDLCTIGEFLKRKFTTPQDLERAQLNFTESMAGSSLMCYLLGIKDRHNGNIMLYLDTGYVQHIDFGFVLGMAPGKDKVKHINASFERAAFKLTPELVEAMGGKKSDNWKHFNQLLVDGLMEARKPANAETLLTMVEIMGYRSKLPCFTQPGGGVSRVIKEFKSRLMLHLSDAQAEKRMRKLAEDASNSFGTNFYEWFQERSNGYAPCK